MAKAASGGTVPQGAACEECYRLWSKAFNFVTFEVLCEKVSKDAVLKAAVVEARSAHLQGGSKDLVPEEVYAVSGISFEVERSYLVASERDMRRAAGLQRVGKTALKGLPSVTCVAEDGSGKEETLYLFEDTTCPLRRGKLRVSMSSNHQRVKMKAADVLWCGQGSEFQNMTWQAQSEESKLKDVVGREMAGHLNLMSWDSFLEERLCTSERVCADGEKQEQIVNDEFEENSMQCELVGVAAQDNAAQRWTPQPKSKKGSPSLVKQGSFRSQASGSVLDGGSVSGKVGASEDGHSVAEPEEPGASFLSFPFFFFLFFFWGGGGDVDGAVFFSSLEIPGQGGGSFVAHDLRVTL